MSATIPSWPGRAEDVVELVSIMGPDTAAIATRSLDTIGKGLIWQPYMDKVPNEGAFAAGCIRWKKAGGAGVAIHGTSVWLAQNYARFARIVIEHGLLVLAACGMNSDDMDKKAHRLGEILQGKDCDGIALDLEGKGEDESAPAEWSHGMLFARTFAPYRKANSQKLVVTQDWPVPTSHWSRYPHECLVAVCDARAPQYYDEDWAHIPPDRRHAECLHLFDHSQEVLEQRLASQGLARPRWITMQGYGHADGERAGLRDYLRRSLQHPVLVWAEWFPSELVLAEIAAIHPGG